MNKHLMQWLLLRTPSYLHAATITNAHAEEANCLPTPPSSMPESGDCDVVPKTCFQDVSADATLAHSSKFIHHVVTLSQCVEVSILYMFRHR